MGHHVHGAAGGLIGGQGAGEPGVQHGEFGPYEVRLGAAPFQVAVFLRNHAAVGAFAASGGNSQHRADRQRALNFGLAGEEIPEIAVVGDAHADGFGGVDDAAAANGQQEVHALFPGKGNPFIHLATAGIGLHAPQLAPGNPRFFQGRGGSIVSAVF